MVEHSLLLLCIFGVYRILSVFCIIICVNWLNIFVILSVFCIIICVNWLNIFVPWQIYRPDRIHAPNVMDVETTERWAIENVNAEFINGPSMFSLFFVC